MSLRLYGRKNCFPGIREQFREYIGNGQITDQEGQAYLIRENEVPKQKSDMIFPRQEIHGEFVLTGYFHVKMLELFRNNVLLMVAEFLRWDWSFSVYSDG